MKTEIKISLFLLLLVILLLSPLAEASGQYSFYAELGIGFADEETAAPEFQVHGYLGRAAIGLESKNGFQIEIEHTSSVEYYEEGYGLNVLWATKRFRF